MLFLWKVEVEEIWDFNKKDDNLDSQVWNVSADVYEKALEKAKNLSKKKRFVDDGEDGDGKTHKCIDARLIHIFRISKIDA